MKYLIAALAAFTSSVTGWGYTPDVPSKTVTTDGSSTDVMAASLYVKDTAAEDGWTIIVGTAGASYTWSIAEVSEVYFNMPHNCTVKGASPTNRPIITLQCQFTIEYAPSKLIQIKDIEFIVDRASVAFYVRGSGPTAGFRFSNVKWSQDGNAQTMWIGSIQGATTDEGPYGLIDNCEGVGKFAINIYANSTSADSGELGLIKEWRRPMAWGTEKAVYIEDSYFHSDTFLVGTGLTDPFNAGSFVFRHNVVENRVVLDHGADHYSNHVRSSKKKEIMHNTFRMTENGKAAQWMIFLRGGTAAIFDNTFQVTGTGGASLAYGIYWNYYRADTGSGPDNGIYDRFYSPLSTTITSGSNGVDLASKPFTVHVGSTAALGATDIVGPVYTKIAAGSNGQTLPQGTINVVSTADFPSSGTLRIGTPSQVGAYGDYAEVNYTGKTSTTFTGCTGGARLMTTGDAVAGAESPSSTKWAIFFENIKITTSAGVQTVNATGKTATTLTGVTGGTGTMSTGGAVTRASDYFGTQQPGSGTITALIGAGSNGATLPQGTIHVDSTTGFPSSGTLKVDYDPITGAGATVAYTGKTSTTFTGCTGGTGAMATGDSVVGIGQDPRHPTEPWGSMPIWQWNNREVTSAAVGSITGKSAHDFIATDRDIFIEDAETSKPAATGTWLDEYTEYTYPHPLNDFAASSGTGRKRAKIGGKDIRIGGKVLRIGDN